MEFEDSFAYGCGFTSDIIHGVISFRKLLKAVLLSCDFWFNIKDEVTFLPPMLGSTLNKSSLRMLLPSLEGV